MESYRSAVLTFSHAQAKDGDLGVPAEDPTFTFVKSPACLGPACLSSLWLSDRPAPGVRRTTCHGDSLCPGSLFAYDCVTDLWLEPARNRGLFFFFLINQKGLNVTMGPGLEMLGSGCCKAMLSCDPEWLVECRKDGRSPGKESGKECSPPW